MGRRASAEEDSSVDLFLSTSCDAFGGIIFIMLMICLLPGHNQASKQESEQPRVAAIEIKNETSRPQLMPNLSEDQKSDLSRKLEDLDKQIKEFSVSATVLNAEAINKERGLNELKEMLHKNSEKNPDQEDTRQTRMPRLRELDKKNFFIVLRYDRVYMPLIPAEGPWKKNDIDFTISQNGNLLEFSPLEKHGADSKLWSSSRDGLQAVNRSVARENYVVLFVVYPDSIGAFNRIRNIFSGMGYDYNWAPLGPSESLHLVAKGGKTEAQ